MKLQFVRLRKDHIIRDGDTVRVREGCGSQYFHTYDGSEGIVKYVGNDYASVEWYKITGMADTSPNPTYTLPLAHLEKIHREVA